MRSRLVLSGHVALRYSGARIWANPGAARAVGGVRYTRRGRVAARVDATREPNARDLRRRRQAPSPTNQAASPSPCDHHTGTAVANFHTNGTSSLRPDVSALLERIQCVLSCGDDFAQLHPKTTRIRPDRSEILGIKATSGVVAPCLVGPADARFKDTLGVSGGVLESTKVSRRVSHASAQEGA